MLSESLRQKIYLTSLRSHQLPLPQGEGLGEGMRKANDLMYGTPHPVLLPEGEGTHFDEIACAIEGGGSNSAFQS